MGTGQGHGSSMATEISTIGADRFGMGGGRRCGIGAGVKEEGKAWSPASRLTTRAGPAPRTGALDVGGLKTDWRHCTQFDAMFL